MVGRRIFRGFIAKCDSSAMPEWCQMEKKDELRA